MSKPVFRDDTGPRLPCGCHGGDLLSRWQRGQQDAVRAILDDIAVAGFHFVRSWSYLAGSYWAGREVEATVDGLMGYVEALGGRGLKLLLSQGDLWQSQVPSSARTRVRSVTLDVLADHRDLFVGVDAANEGVNNGSATPRQLADWLAPIAAAHPDLILTLTSPVEGSNAEAHAAIRKAYCVSPATIYDHHIAGSDGLSCARRHWNEGYENPPLWLGIASEPRGPGQRVSVTRVSDVNELLLMAVTAVMAGQAYCYMSGPGVVSDEGERFADMPGFHEVPALIASLPRDLHTFSTRVHGGKETWKGTRIYATPVGNDETRADQVLHDDGRFLAALYCHGWGDCVQERRCRIERVITFNDAGKLVIGRTE